MAEEKREKVGESIHYFGNISVGVVKATDGQIKVGDNIRIKGTTTDLEQEVSSLQVDKDEVKVLKKGKEAGMKVDDRVREGDEIFLV